MAKVLVTAHLGRHFKIFGHYDYKVLLSLGHEVHIAANFHDEIDQFEDHNVIKHQVDFSRNPFSFGNLKAMNQLEKIINKNQYEIIHTQSPSGGAVTRLAARRTRKNGTKVLYTPHGFHFFKGAPVKNWLIYYNIEKLLGYLTDTIITINDEDYELARKRLLIKDVRQIHGVGIDLNKFKPQTYEKKVQLRKQYGYSEDDFILVYAGELSYRKNQELVIRSLCNLKDKIPNIKLLIAGTGDFLGSYKELVEVLKLNNNVHFLGYRNDVVNLMLLSDIAVSASRQEGLPVNVMEAMATGLPLVVTNCRGNRDLVSDNENGFIVDQDNPQSFSSAIEKIYNSKELKSNFSIKSLNSVKEYSLDKVKKEMIDIYQSLL